MESATKSMQLTFYSILSDLYEGTRIASVTDLSRIRQLILPLEESGKLIRRTDQEVCTLALSYFCSTGLDNFADVLTNVKTEKRAY